MSDRVVILGRPHPSKAWELLYICERKEDAFTLAAGIEDQEHNVFKLKTYRCVVISEDNYDAKNFKPMKGKPSDAPPKVPAPLRPEPKADPKPQPPKPKVDTDLFS